MPCMRDLLPVPLLTELDYVLGLFLQRCRAYGASAVSRFSRLRLVPGYSDGENNA